METLNEEMAHRLIVFTDLVLFTNEVIWGLGTEMFINPCEVDNCLRYTVFWLVRSNFR